MAIPPIVIAAAGAANVARTVYQGAQAALTGAAVVEAIRYYTGSPNTVPEVPGPTLDDKLDGLNTDLEAVGPTLEGIKNGVNLTNAYLDWGFGVGVIDAYPHSFYYYFNNPQSTPNPVFDPTAGPFIKGILHSIAAEGSSNLAANRASEAETAALAANETANTTLQETTEIGLDVLALWDGIKAFYRSVGYYSLDEAGVTAFNVDLALGKINGSGLFVLRTDEETGEQVPALNPNLLTFTDPNDDERFNLLEIAVDVLTSIPFRPSR